MQRCFCALLLCLTLSSCATLVTRRSYRMAVRSRSADARIMYEDSTYKLPAILRVPRSGYPLKLQFIAGDTTRSLSVCARPNPAFLFGNLGWLQMAPAAYLIDLTNPKRFYYGKNLAINAEDTTTIYRATSARWRAYWGRSYAAQKGDVALQLSIPIVSSFLLRPEGEGAKETVGCLGIGAGFSYAYRDRRGLGLSGGVAIDNVSPFPAAVDYAGLYERYSSLWAALMHYHYPFRRLSFGYGVAYSLTSWRLAYGHDAGTTPPARTPVTQSSVALGVMAAASFRVNKALSAGLSYRASLLGFHHGDAAPYEHVISFELAYPLRLRREMKEH